MLQAPADFLLGQNHFLHSSWAMWKVTPHTGFSVTSTQNSQSQPSFGSYGIHFSVLGLNFILFHNIPSPPYSSFRNLAPHLAGFPLCPRKAQSSWAQVSSLVAPDGCAGGETCIGSCEEMEESCCSQPHLLERVRDPLSSPCLSLRGSPASWWGEIGQKKPHSFNLSAGKLNVKFRLNKPCNATS